MAKSKKSKADKPVEEKVEFKKRSFKLSRLAIMVFFFFAPLLLAIIIIEGVFWDRIFPGVSVAGINISGLTKQGAITAIDSNFKQRQNQPLVFDYQGQAVSVDLKNAEIDSKDAVDTAWEYGRKTVYLPGINLTARVSFPDTFSKQTMEINHLISQPATNSQLRVEGDSISVTPSQNGKGVDETALKNIATNYLLAKNTPPRDLPTAVLYPQISYNQAIAVKQTLDKIKQQPLKLTYGSKEWTMDLATVTDMIDWQSSQTSLINSQIGNVDVDIQIVSIGQSTYSDTKISLNSDRLVEYLQKQIQPDINQDVQEPLFKFENGRVTEFRPPVVGQRLDLIASSQKINDHFIDQDLTPVPLTVQKTNPVNKLSNDLGIKENIGEGYSEFAHSIPNRIYNVGLAASRVNGVIVAPGETFSFVKTVGDISGASGYKPAYVIKSGRTVLDDGGGVCQVSTTIFRAALNAGLPIVARTAHAYRVGYYEEAGFPPGIDATIFSPSVDLQFKNDTTASILIQAIVVGTTLTIDFYGTSDGRVATLTRPVVSGVTPAPPDLRQDDPTLPKGTVKQVDFAAAGANVSFSRTVKRDGQILINETFRSNYKPWQAVYLVGTM